MSARHARLVRMLARAERMARAGFGVREMARATHLSHGVIRSLVMAAGPVRRPYRAATYEALLAADRARTTHATLLLLAILESTATPVETVLEDIETLLAVHEIYALHASAHGYGPGERLAAPELRSVAAAVEEGAVSFCLCRRCAIPLAVAPGRVARCYRPHRKPAGAGLRDGVRRRSGLSP